MSTASSTQDGVLASIISPEAVEKIASDALAGTFKKAAENLSHDFYDSCQQYLYEHFQNFESQVWDQVANQVIRGYASGRWAKYNHKHLRETLFREHREEIIKEIGADLVAENEQLKEDLEAERNIRRY